MPFWAIALNLNQFKKVNNWVENNSGTLIPKDAILGEGAYLTDLPLEYLMESKDLTNDILETVFD